MPDAAPRLLIIDARMESTALLLPQLRPQVAEVIIAHDPEDGLTQARGSRPDAIVIDLDPCAGIGPALCNRLTAGTRPAATPVIALGAGESLGDKLQAFAAGAADYVAKPFAAAEVLARLQVHLAAKRRIDCLEAMATSHALDRVAAIAQRDDQIFAKAAACLQQRLSDPPGLTELARGLGINERKLTELFRERVGMTVFDYFAELRLETARRILEGSDVPIQIVAYKVGYSNPGDFTRAFRRRYAVSPRGFRQTLAIPGRVPPRPREAALALD